MTDDLSEMHGWCLSYEKQLENIKNNASQEAEICREKYLKLKHSQKYFKIPVIVISGLNSIFAVGMTQYINQDTTSLINCLLSFLVSIISSIELYLEIHKKIDVALQSYQEFYLLSIQINNVLRIERQNRIQTDGSAYLAECLSTYERLFQSNNVNETIMDDQLSNVNL